MIPWWVWLLLWGGVAIGALLAIVYFIFFMVSKGLGIAHELSDSFEKMPERKALGAQTWNSSPMPAAQVAAGLVQKPWADYYGEYHDGKKLRQNRRREARMLDKKRAGRPQRLKDIEAAERHGEELREVVKNTSL